MTSIPSSGPESTSGGTSGSAATAKAASLAAEHPEFLVAGALVGGAIIAKVVKHLAA